MTTSFSQRGYSNQIPGIVVTVVAIAVGRLWGAFDRVPPDPGVDFYLESRRDGLTTLFREEGGYLDVPRRVLSQVVSLAPTEYWVIASNLLWLGLIAICSVVVYTTVWSASISRLTSFGAAMTYVLSPSMSESQLGHESVVKWSLLFVLSVLLAREARMPLPSKRLILLVIICCLSNPVAFSLVPIFLISRFKEIKRRDPRAWAILSAFLFPLSLQFIVWLRSGQSIQKYGGDTIYLPWDGIGFFWIFNWMLVPVLAPPLLGVEYLLRNHRQADISKTLSSYRVNLLIASILVWTVSYAIGGIADRYFVVPQTLLWISAILLITDLRDIRFTALAQNLVGIGVTLLLSLAAARWFTASAFLSASPRWSSDISEAEVVCLRGEQSTVLIPQSLNVIEMDCKLLN